MDESGGKGESMRVKKSEGLENFNLVRSLLGKFLMKLYVFAKVFTYLSTLAAALGCSSHQNSWKPKLFLEGDKKMDVAKVLIFTAVFVSSFRISYFE